MGPLAASDGGLSLLDQLPVETPGLVIIHEALHGRLVELPEDVGQHVGRLAVRREGRPVNRAQRRDDGVAVLATDLAVGGRGNVRKP